ncbi:MAG: aspartate-semialdehyde dehydrogenase [Gammaproteobacteria bacterium]|nr:aspartate-semialdehyde dehydrogenase [Gammaproteobacteria bacterium]|tara:strand:- start:8836 stop:9852 length:1017 start_codon:yes stop_codon:yes gene_type:complete
MNNAINIALVGASGVVGSKIISLLEKKNVNINNFYPLGSSSVGDEISFNNKTFIIEDLSDFDSSKVHLAIFSAGSKVAKKYANDFVSNGVYVIDLSSEFRYDDDVPLIIPEINGNILKDIERPLLIANPNCSVSQLLMAIEPIHKNFDVDLLNVATYQAVSGTGKDAVKELNTQIEDSNAEAKVYPKKIAFNVIPQCDIFLENDFTKEEMKVAWETKKILDPNIEVTATCVRVPVVNGHSEAVFLRTKKPISKDNIINLLSATRGVKIIDNPSNLEYPTPLENANDTEDVFVGRIRTQTVNKENWVSMWIVADNVYGKGAALNAVQIIEMLIEENKLC